MKLSIKNSSATLAENNTYMGNLMKQVHTLLDTDSALNQEYKLTTYVQAINHKLVGRASVDFIQDDRCLHRVFFDFNKQLHCTKITRRSEKLVRNLYSELFTIEYINALILDIEAHYLAKSKEE